MCKAVRAVECECRRDVRQCCSHCRRRRRPDRTSGRSSPPRRIRSRLGVLWVLRRTSCRLVGRSRRQASTFRRLALASWSGGCASSFPCCRRLLMCSSRIGRMRTTTTRFGWDRLVRSLASRLVRLGLGQICRCASDLMLPLRCRCRYSGDS